MKIKFYFGIILALFVGLSVGYVFKVGAIKTYLAVQNFIQERNSVTKNLGGPELEEDEINNEDYAEENLIENQEEPTEEMGDYEIKAGAVFPKITSKAYMITDVDSGQVIKSYADETVFPIASVSKLMTALVSTKLINQDMETSISSKAVGTYGRAGSLRSGEIYSMGNLIYPLLLESSNDAAEAIAEFYGRNNFISAMNQTAKDIGLENTSFEDPSGLSPKNKSSVQDLSDLVQYIYKYNKNIFDISRLKQKELGKKIWYSNSKFRNDKNIIGAKNGYTVEAKYTQVVVLELPLGKGSNKMRNISIVLLQGRETEKDVRAIEKYLLSNVYFAER